MRRFVLPILGALAIVAGALFVIQDRPGLPAPAATATASASASASASVATAPSATASATATAAVRIPLGYRIQIPRLGIDLPIDEGDVARDTVEQQTPEGYAFHLPGTAIPSAGGNSYLYAHARRGMFLSLWDAKVGDVVWLSTPDGRALKYVVTEVHPRVAPDDVSWVRPTKSERLTLQTSTGPNRTDPRFVVVATPG